jgi:hypothetical protein
MKALRNISLLLLFTALNLSSFCQAIVKPQVLTKTEWENYFAKHFKINGAEVKVVKAPGDIPYPSTWKYVGDIDKEKKDKYLLYSTGPNTDYMVMPSNNGAGTYLFYFDHKNPENDLVEMNFLADSIQCRQLSPDVLMFQFNDDGFKIKGDSSGFKRYIFVSKTGRFASKSLVAHACSVILNSVDSLHSLIYLNIIYAKGSDCKKCFKLDYRNFTLLTDYNDVEDLSSNIVIDAVHYISIKKVEEGAK